MAVVARLLLSKCCQDHGFVIRTGQSVIKVDAIAPGGTDGDFGQVANQGKAEGVFELVRMRRSMLWKKVGSNNEVCCEIKRLYSETGARNNCPSRSE